MTPLRDSKRKAPKAPQGLEVRSVYRVSGRAFAVVLDSTLLAFIYTLAWAGIATQYPSQEFGSAVVLTAAIAILVIYHTLFEAMLGWTPGKLLTELRVVDKATLRKLTFSQALVRNLLRPLDALFGYIVGFVVATSSTYRQRIGDHVARTLVVDAGFRQHLEEAKARQRRQQAGARAEHHVSHELSKLAAFDGDYYVWNDLEEAGIGNIDHLVVGPGGLTIIETKSNRGVVRVEGHEPPTVDGRPLHRDVLKQIQNQRRAVVRRLGFGDVDPDRVSGFNWLICFTRGELSPDLAPNVRRRLATTRDLRGKIRSQPRHTTPEGVQRMAHAVEGLYGREPDHSPSGPRQVQPDGLARDS